MSRALTLILSDEAAEEVDRWKERHGLTTSEIHLRALNLLRKELEDDASARLFRRRSPVKGVLEEHGGPVMEAIPEDVAKMVREGRALVITEGRGDFPIVTGKQPR